MNKTNTYIACEHEPKIKVVQTTGILLICRKCWMRNIGIRGSG